MSNIFLEGPTFSRKVKLFPGAWGGVQMLILETHRTCDFPGGGCKPSIPLPSWSAHVTILLLVIDRRDFTDSYTVLVRKCICWLGQAQSPDPKGYVQIHSNFLYDIVMEQIKYTC